METSLFGPPASSSPPRARARRIAAATTLQRTVRGRQARTSRRPAVGEVSAPQARDLEAALGPEWGVAVAACDPDAWAASSADGPADGAARGGGGVARRRARLALLETDHFWLSPTPERPSPRQWEGASHYQRTCHVSHLRDLRTKSARPHLT